MKFIFLCSGVLCTHLALLGWLQVSQPQNPPGPTVMPIQTRQILTSSPSQAPAAQHTLRRPDPGLTQAIPTPKLKNATAPIFPADNTTPKPDASSLPLNAGIGNDTDSPARSDKSARAAAPLTDQESTGKAAPSTGVQLPSSNADYLNNTPPPYPALSLRLRETGRVVVRVLIGKNGLAVNGQIIHSSGFDRLDQSALKAALAWRYIPGKVDGQARDMWFDIPISFNLPN